MKEEQCLAVRLLSPKWLFNETNSSPPSSGCSNMNVPTHDTIGLAIYKELLGNERRSLARSAEQNQRALQGTPVDPATLINFIAFDNVIATPVPPHVSSARPLEPCFPMAD